MRTPLILLHGAIGSSSQLHPLAEKLSTDFDCFAMNFSGHGGLPIPGDPFSMEMFSSGLEEFILTNRLQPADVFGYSMGGDVAVYLVKEHPGLINRIITLGTKWKWTPEMAAREVTMLDPEKIALKVPEFAKALEARHAPQDWKLVLKKTAEMMLAMGDKNPLTLSDCEAIINPVLVCLGDNDKMVTLDESEEVAKVLPKGKLQIMEGTEHPIEKANLELLAATIRNFLANFGP